MRRCSLQALLLPFVLASVLDPSARYDARPNLPVVNVTFTRVLGDAFAQPDPAQGIGIGGRRCVDYGLMDQHVATRTPEWTVFSIPGNFSSPELCASAASQPIPSGPAFYWGDIVRSESERICVETPSNGALTAAARAATAAWRRGGCPAMRATIYRGDPATASIIASASNLHHRDRALRQ